MDGADRGFDLLGARVLGQVAPRPCLQRGNDRLPVGVSGQHQHPAGRQPFTQLCRRGDAVDAGHPQVHHDHVGVVSLGESHGLGSVAGRADDVDPVDERDQHA